VSASIAEFKKVAVLTQFLCKFFTWSCIKAIKGDITIVTPVSFINAGT